MIDAAKALVRRGARIDFSTAAGLGLEDQATRRLPGADAEARHRGLSLAAQEGHVEIVRMLLDAGEDPTATTSKATTPTPRRCTRPCSAVTRR